jgi:ATP-GRASP peptide maturase of grasp-with-spasm system
MLLILSDENDFSTQQVINWLLYNQTPYLRVNRTSGVSLESLSLQDSVTEFSLELSESYLPMQSRSVHSSELSAYWYRRGYLNLKHEQLKCSAEDDEMDCLLKNGINSHLSRENSKVTELLNHYLRSLPHMGSVFDNATNKFVNSFLAEKFGLVTPKSLVTGNKQAFLAFNEATGTCIAKSIDRAGFTIGSEIGLGNTTALISPEIIDAMPRRFNLTLFQQFIDKLFDIRSFFLNGRFYTACIMSQLNEQTRVDFRNYDSVKPNRIVPFQLPKALEQKLSNLMQSLKMKTGSIDLLKDAKGVYYFLEVNPIGQYGFISDRCNFYLDKQIAKSF